MSAALSINKNSVMSLPTSGTVTLTTESSSDHGNTVETNDDSEMEDLTPYDKKSRLITRELDAMGMGRYQWYIWSLCGLGYFLDLLWAQAFGLIATPLQRELGFSDVHLANVFTAFSAGLTAGAFCWGVLVDIIGRKWAFNGTVFCTCVFGLSLGAPDTYSGILVLTAFTGFGIGGNIPIDTTICLEFLPQDRRFLLALLSIFQPIGVVICSGIAYGFIPKYSCAANLPSCNSNSHPDGTSCCTKSSNYGWRYLMFTLGGISFFVFLLRFVVFTFQESPQYLLSKGKDEKALEVLHYIAKFNKKQCKLTLETFQILSCADTSYTTSSDNGQQPNIDVPKVPFSQKVKIKMKRMSGLFATPGLARLTFLVWVIYAFDYWGFSVAGSLLPTILARKNASINVSIAETYRDYVIIYLPGIAGVILGSLMVYVPRIGRKWAMVFSSAMMGVSLFLFATVNTHASNIGINAMEYFFQSMFNSVLYGWTPEAFPAPIRGTACGLASFWGRLFSIFSPLIAGHLLEKDLNGPLYLAGAGTFVCTVAILFLPKSSLGTRTSV